MSDKDQENNSLLFNNHAYLKVFLALMKIIRMLFDFVKYCRTNLQFLENKI